MTPKRAVASASLAGLIARPGVHHLARRGYSGGNYSGRPVLQALPDRKHLNDVWNSDADAIVVIEWNMEETAERIAHMNPVQLFPGNTIESSRPPPVPEPLPNGVHAILEDIASASRWLLL